MTKDARIKELETLLLQFYLMYDNMEIRNAVVSAMHGRFDEAIYEDVRKALARVLNKGDCSEIQSEDGVT